MKQQAIHYLRSCGSALVVCAYLCLAETAGAQFVDMFPAPAPVTPRIHSEFTLEINIHNAGPRNSTNLLVVTNLLPAGWTLVSASVGTFRVGLVDGIQWHVNDPPVSSGATQDGRHLSFRPHPIPAGWWRPLWIVARADTVGYFTNVVSIDPGAGAPDANPANNTLAHVIEVRPPALSVHGWQSAAEQSGGNSEFVVRLTGSNSVPVTVEYQTRDETARAGEDYQATSGALTFPPGVLEQTVAVPVLDDALEEDTLQWFGAAWRRMRSR